METGLCPLWFCCSPHARAQVSDGSLSRVQGMCQLSCISLHPFEAIQCDHIPYPLNPVWDTKKEKKICLLKWF